MGVKFLPTVTLLIKINYWVSCNVWRFSTLKIGHCGSFGRAGQAHLFVQRDYSGTVQIRVMCSLVNAKTQKKAKKRRNHGFGQAHLDVHCNYKKNGPKLII